MSGSVRKDVKRGTWYFVIDVPGAEGRRRRTWRRGFPTRRKALDELEKFRAELRAGRVPAPSDDSVSALARAWIAALPAEGVEPATVKHYHEAVSRLLPTIGDVKVQELTALDLDGAYAVLLHAGRSARTVRASHVAARKMLAEAQRIGKVGNNVATRARPPSARAARPRTFATWTYEQTERFLATTTDDEHAALWQAAAWTGLRRGELVALLWDDVDFDAAAITVSRSVGKGLDGVHDKAPKSDAGRRMVELDAPLVELFRRHRQAQRERRLVIGPGWQERGLVFCEVDGSPVHPDRLTQRWSRLVRRHAETAEVQPIRFHDLRHSHATQLLEAGVRPDIVTERLGHASVAFTLQQYAHRYAGDQRSGLARLRAARSG
jgi:integrase